MKPSRITEVLRKLLGTTWPVFVWGPPGVGKSSVVRQIAAEVGLGLIDIRASLLDPTDLRGLPAVTDGQAVWYPPSFLPSDPDSRGILFFDELNAAPPLVQASLYQLTLDRRIGEYVLPRGWRIIAAGNRAEDASVTFRMPAALSNRFIHLDFEVNHEDWRHWAQAAGIHPLVTGFISFKPKLLFEMSTAARAFPTPRSWEMLSTALMSFGAVDAMNDLLVGIVGEGAAIEFLAFSRLTFSEERINAIIQNPGTEELPADLGSLYTLVSYLGSWAKRAEVQRAAGVLLGRLSPEIGLLLARDMLRANARFILDPGYQAFASAHQAFIT